jgi:hypothetical protein
MPPVHTVEVGAAIAQATYSGPQRVGEEGTELCLVHLTRGHRELAMASGSHDFGSTSSLQVRHRRRQYEKKAQPMCINPRTDCARNVVR